MKRILATNTGDTTITRQLLDDPALDVLFVTEQRFVDQYPPGAQIAVVPSLNDPAAAAEAVVRSRAVDDRTHAVGLTERSMLAAAYLRSYLGLPGPSAETILSCTNKYAMKRRFRAAGLATADVRLAAGREQVRAAADELGFPVIVKPLMGAGVDATMVLATEEDATSREAAAFFARLERPRTTSEKSFPVVVEPYLPVDLEYHCDGFVYGGEIRYACVSLYLRPVLSYGSGIFGSETLDDADPRAVEICAMHARAVEAVGLDAGATHFEVLDVGGSLFAGEIAARPGGGGIRRMLELRDGIDVRTAHVAAALGTDYLWPSTRSGQRWVQVMLPAERGRIVDISADSDFGDVPGVVEVEMKLTPGDDVGGLMDSSTVSGVVYASLESATADEVVAAVAAAFRLEVEAAA